MKINKTTLQQKLNSDKPPILIDVRSEEEHKEKNIGGMNIPLHILSLKLKTIENHKNDEIVVYCRSGARSEVAQNILISMGFKNVLNLENGIMTW